MTFAGVAKKHGAYLGGRENPMHSRWRAMILRCHDPKNQNFASYGGRGIFVCERWRNEDTGYPAFCADMGERPTLQHSIDRIDNDGPYSPENCRWATRGEQGENRRTCRMVTMNGRQVPLSVAAKATGLTHAVLWHRLSHGWTEHDALQREVPKRTKRSPKRVTVHGEQLTIPEAARQYGIGVNTFRKRILNGWTPEEATSPSLHPYRTPPRP